MKESPFSMWSPLLKIYSWTFSISSWYQSGKRISFSKNKLCHSNTPQKISSEFSMWAIGWPPYVTPTNSKFKNFLIFIILQGSAPSYYYITRYTLYISQIIALRFPQFRTRQNGGIFHRSLRPEKHRITLERFFFLEFQQPEFYEHLWMINIFYFIG